MAIVRYTAGNELTPERRAEMKAEIEAAAKRPYVYDPDGYAKVCPTPLRVPKEEFLPRTTRTNTNSDQISAKSSWCSTHCRSPKGDLAFLQDSGIYWCYAMRHYFIYTVTP